jgi:AcrR family transcriptional regulator
VSVRDIVQACGLSNAALYYHFGSKQNLFVEVFRAYVAELVRKVQEAGEGKRSCRDRLASLAEAYARVVLDARIEGRTLLRDLRDLVEVDGGDTRHLILDAEGQIPSMFAEVLEDGISTGEIRAVDAQRVGLLLHGMVNALVARRMFGRAAGPLTEDIDLAINTLLYGIGA